ncbi:phosphatidylinositol-binding protein scs2 [Mortierella antarctica]|nr:phosphatidylinositol-binding protein scs2 [Mortierella antarctica]
MSVELEPSTQLSFRRPLTEAIKETLLIRNPTQLPIAFKVKTTAPRQYCVRPNSGRVEPGQELEVQVQMQAMKEDPPADYKCKDKFLVQSIAITAEREQLLPTELWPMMEKDAKDQIREKKIRCAFLPAFDSAITHIKEEDDHAVQSAFSVRDQPQQSSLHTTVSASSVSSPPSPGSEVQTLRRDLQAARDTIQNLQSSMEKLQSETGSLRQRKPESSSPSAPTMTAVHLKQAQGYPLSYVAGAAAVAFIVSHQTGSRFGSNSFGGNSGGFASSNSFGALSGNSGGSGGFGGSSSGGGFGQRGFGGNAGGGGFGNNNNNSGGSAFGRGGGGNDAGAGGQKKIAYDDKTIKTDITTDRPIHELSSYAPGKEEPNLISGKDMQPEELRLMYYEAQNAVLTQATGDYSGLAAAAAASGAGPAGLQNAYMQKMQQLNGVMDQEIQKIVQNPQAAFSYFMNSIRTGSGTANAPATTSGGSAFGQPSAFGQSSAFGQTSTLSGNSAFGQTASLGGNSAFGQPSALGGTSAFGQTSAAGGNSAFGQTSALTSNSAFGQTSALGGGSGFGQTSTLGGGSSAFGQQQLGSNTTFGQPSALGTASAFGQGGAGASAFGNPAATQQPASAFGTAGFAQQSAFGNNAAPATAAAGTVANSAFGGSGFLGGQQQQSQQLQQTSTFGQQSAFGNMAQASPFSQGGNNVQGAGNAFAAAGGAVSGSTTAVKDTATNAGTLKMVKAVGLKSSKKGEPLTEEEIAAYRAPAFDIKRVPEQEPPMELR